MSDMPDSNKSWKSRYFFIEGSNWVCHPKEWVTMPRGFDNTWGIVKASGLALIAFIFFLTLSAFSIFISLFIVF